MSRLRRSLSLILLTMAIPFILVALLVFTASAASQHADEALDQAQPFVDSGSTNSAKETAAAMDELAQVQILAAGQTTLAVTILSSPNPIYDKNGDNGPNAFVVQALVSNTGNTTATDVTVHLDYNEDPTENWMLLPGEDPERKVTEIAPGAGVHNYWFATYPTSTGTIFTHTYTVTAQAVNASPVSASDNFYGDEPETPLPAGITAHAIGALSTGNNSPVQSASEVALGVAFTVTAEYDISPNADALIFSPVGNTAFNPAAYRMIASSVRLSNNAVYTDQLYIPSPGNVSGAEVSYIFLAVAPADTELCPYMAVDSNSNIKYDLNKYCDEVENTIIDITGTTDISLAKQASDLLIQQNETLTYTIDYTNSGDLAANLVWVWDDVDTSMVNILTPTISPAADSGESSDSRVAWYIGTIPASTNGTLTFATAVDGNGQDLSDGALIVNEAFLGINDGFLPSVKALTSTFTTTIVAPNIDISKSDGYTSAGRGQELTYTLKITNSGSITATNLVLTDVLPTNVSYTPSSASIVEDVWTGTTLIWQNLGPISPTGQLEIQIPVTVDSGVPDGTILTNEATVKYENTAGYVYDTKTATDTTTVAAPILAISKIESNDPVFVGKALTYTISYSNSGTSAASNTVITDRVPLNTTYQSCSGGSSCGMLSGIVSWTLGLVSGVSNSPVNFSVLVSDSLNTGTVLSNEDYGIVADYHDFVAGELVTTTVTRDAAIFDGYAFQDNNNNGVKDIGELGIVNVTVTLPSAVQPTQITDASGYYSFRVESQGAISVTSELLADLIRTTPATIYSNAVFGITQTVDFGFTSNSVPYASIYGTVFTDTNGNGIQGAGEFGIAGVTVTLDSGVEAVTNIYGNYTLSTTTAAVHTVTETDPPNHFSTTPNNVNVNVALGSSYEVNFGDALNGSGFGVVMGTVFEDANGNGLMDSTELGISNVSVSLDGTDTTTTNAYGYYTLSTTTEDVHTVTETDPDGYFSTTPNNVNVDVKLGSSYEVNFGDSDNSGIGVVMGTVFDDENGNGQMDNTELGISNVSVSLDGTDTTTTNAYGHYTLSTITATVHTVTEVDPANHFSTTPNNVNVDVALGSSYEVNFGDALNGSGFGVVMGTVFTDTNGNGLMDNTELGISGVTVSLEGADTTTTNSYTTTTNAYGNYSFASLVTGTHQVTEADLPGYFSTTPNEVHLTLNLNQAHVVDFGDALESEAGFLAFYGTVFEDKDDRNGQMDSIELGISGVTVTLDSGVEAVTNIYGSFSLSSTAGGSHTVVETDPPGYLSTTPNSVTENATVIGAGYQIDYGDFAECTNDDYEDDDAADQANDLGVGQVQSHNFCDDDEDWQKFSALAGNTYIITTYSSGQRADTFLTLFDTDALTQLAANDDHDGSSDFSSRIVWKAPATGQYFIRTTNRAGLSGLVTDYEIGFTEEIEVNNDIFLPVILKQTVGQTRATEKSQMTFRPIPMVAQDFAESWSWLLGEIDHACADSFEIDDTWQEAGPIVPGIKQVHSFDSDPLLYAADKDFVSFDMPANSTITFNIATMTNTDTLMEIYDDQGAALGVSGSDELVWSNPTSGRYYLSVSPPPTANNFGCIDKEGFEEVSYELLAELVTIPNIYIPVVFKD